MLDPAPAFLYVREADGGTPAWYDSCKTSTQGLTTNRKVSQESIAILLAELQQLRADVAELKERVPDTRRVWLEPGEFAALVNRSTKTISNWRNEGKFRDTSIRPYGKGWLFHREHALADLDRGQG